MQSYTTNIAADKLGEYLALMPGLPMFSYMQPGTILLAENLMMKDMKLGCNCLQDVAQAAVGIVMAAEGCSEETVRSRFTSMSKERRIQKDVW